MRFSNLLLCALLIVPSLAMGQGFTRQDTLRGLLSPARIWWDVTYYDLRLDVNPEDSTIKGSNLVRFRADMPGDRMQIDLQEPMIITSVKWKGRKLKVEREGNAWFIQLRRTVPKGRSEMIQIDFVGKPRVANYPPWDGGLVWKSDSLGRPWVGVACQGDGASLWWPCKDHQSDEPDSMKISVAVPKGLMNISNGRLVDHRSKRGKETWVWKVRNPINTYNVTINVGKYVHFTDTLVGEKGPLSLDFYTLDYNLEKGRQQFAQTKPMLDCFEYWFGAFPWYEDGFTIVETSYLGMEHQSAIAYGNGFKNGYRERDLSGSGWGMKWDFIIIHETGHEWFGNNITTRDIADMWVHEGFTNYSEVLYTECRFGKEAGNAYAQGLRNNIRNDKPVIGPYDVNTSGSGDMYYKASNMLHTLRQLVENDSLFRITLRNMNTEFGGSTTSSAEVEAFLSKAFNIDLTEFFNQYLRTANLPALEYYVANDELHFRWSDVVEGFDMPIKVRTKILGWTWIYPDSEWKSVPFSLIEASDFRIDPNFCVDIRNVPKESAP